ncbi:hypothetical protein DFQ01_11188 [Paenibacillus cellulosilyticus]|uniref:Uncharacterized protein n=1 Tax=Paenibacillus cellulosilyticus TaxID=375489 RepID=A0A2V2YUK6_9BACL|nr:hypothetical protein [Paenibacillus cellulosilyticus]PWW00941.1 hypothetical protein DFQ01_11188 [Paenibacillus cellulosilyticus]QKS47589.1 hypothetical protein HUB94_24775 [Paenibacillus cellulosilyticus]
MNSDIRRAIREFIEIVLTGVGILGGILVVYGILSESISDFNWVFLDKHGLIIANWLTVIGVILTALGIYIKPINNPGEVWPLSKYITAPLVIIFSVVVAYLMSQGKHVPDFVVNGLALLAISGTLIRLFKSSSVWNYLN